MKKTISLLLLVCMLVSLCSGMAFAVEDGQTAGDAAEANAEPSECTLTSVFNSAFYVEANASAALGGRVKVSFDALGVNGTLYLPGKVDAAGLCFSWDNTSITVSADDTVYASGTAPIAPAGESVTYKVTCGAAVSYVTVRTLQGSEGVEPMFLELDESLGTISAMNGDKDHETSCYGRALFGSFDKPISIKGRGNSTWDFPKKPYNITFYKADDYAKKDNTQLIPGVKAKKWSLLANYLDNSLLRNKIAMDLANQLGIGMETRFVDVWMNGEYLGSYLLTPKKDYAAPKDGFMLDNDHIPQDADQFKIQGMHDMLLKHNRINIEDIGDNAVEQGVDQAYIEAYFNEAFAALTEYDTDRYLDYFDLDSWVKMFLMYEVSKTYDCYAGNILMHRDGLTADDKLIAGPAWDYDVAFGRTLHKFLVGVSEPVQLNAEGWFNDSIGLFAVDKPVSLLQEFGKHADFMQRVAELYNENRVYFEDLTGNVDRQQALLRASALMNNARWGTNSLCADYLIAPGTMSLLGTGKYALQYHVTLSWDDYVYNLREYCGKRVQWLSDHLRLEAPAGSVLRQELDDGSVVLQAVLTAGSDANTFQWQSSADGAVWTDIPGATAATYAIPADADGTVQYRCVASNAGTPIYTMHGGLVRTTAQAVLSPGGESARMTQTGLEAGTLTLVLNGQQAGTYTFAAYNGGWSICSADGRYLKPDGMRLVLSDTPFAWTYQNGVFTATAPLARTLLGRLITLGYLRDVYLSVNNGQPSVSIGPGAQASFLKQAG